MAGLGTLRLRQGCPKHGPRANLLRAMVPHLFTMIADNC